MRIRRETAELNSTGVRVLMTPVVERILEIPETALPRKHEAVCAHRGEAVAVEVSCCGGQVRKVSGWHCGQRNASVTLKDCLRCPEHRDKGAALPRTSCLECVQKHLGAAMVLLSESQDGYPEHQLLALGHLHEAAEESRAWPELHEAIRAARIKYQREGVLPEWEMLARLCLAGNAHGRE